jgi:hypothetical protein
MGSMPSSRSRRVDCTRPHYPALRPKASGTDNWMKGDLEVTMAGSVTIAQACPNLVVDGFGI